MFRLITVLAVCLALCPMALSGVAPAGAATLVVTDGVPAATLNPFNILDNVSHRVCIQMFEYLTWLNRHGQVEPWLAEEWSIPQPGVYRFKLRKGVRFHNGRILTADDVVHSLDMAKKGRVGRLLKVKSYRVVGNHEVEIVGTGNLLRELSFAGFVVARPRPNDPADMMTGTGPYRLLSRDKDGQIEMTAFPDYWNRNAARSFDRVVFEVRPGDTERIDSLATRANNIVTDVNPHLKLNLLKGAGGQARLYTQESTRVFGIIISTLPWPGREKARAKLADPRVRQALNLAVDRDRIIEVVMLGNGLLLGSPVAPVIPGSSRAEAYPYDPDRARELIRAAGAEGLELELAYNDSRWYGAKYVSIAVAKYLEAVGLKIKLVSVPWKDYLKDILTRGGRWDLHYLGWGNPTFDPGFVIGMLLGKSPASSWRDERTLTALGEAAKASGYKRLLIFKELDEYLHQAAPWIFLFQKVDSYASSRAVALTTAPNELFRIYYDVKVLAEDAR